MNAHDKDNIEGFNLTTDLTFATSTRLSRSTAGLIAGPSGFGSFCFDKTPSKRLYSGLAGYNKFLCTGLKRMKFFLCLVGMVMIIEGLPYFAFPEKMKFWIQKIAAMPDGSLRRFGLVLMLIGLLLVYFGRK